MQLFGPMQIASACPPSAGVPDALPRGATSPSAFGSTPPTFEPGLPNMLVLDDACGLSFEAGEQLQGEVLDQRESNVLLKFGETTVSARTALSLQQGQRVDLQVTSQPGGRVGLQVVGSQLLCPMSEGDVSLALLQLELPITETNLEVAKAMLTMGLPLQGEDIQALVHDLAHLPHDATPQDVQAAVLLKAGGLPVTPSSLQLLSHFVTEHPFIGAQLMDVQGAFRRLLRDEASRGTLSDALVEMLEGAPGILGELMLDLRQGGGRRAQRRLHGMAFQCGIEAAGPHGRDDLDMQTWLRQLRERLQAVGGGQAERAAAVMADLERSLAAMRLMNSAVTAEQGSFYFQIPLLPSEQTAEARLLYHVDAQGRPVFDPDNAIIDLRIPTVTFGVVSWRIVISRGRLVLDASTEDEAGCEALAAGIGELRARVEALGYAVAVPVCRARAKAEEAEQADVRLPARPFETLARVDVQA